MMYSQCAFTLIIGLLSLFAPTFAQELEENYFINPPTPGAKHQYTENNVYAVGSTINLQWTTDFETLSLVLWQNDNTTHETILDQVPYVQTLQWNVDLQGIGFSLNDSALLTPNVFFFELWQITNLDTGAIGKRFASHYFNITGSGPTSTDSSATMSNSITASQGSAPADATNTGASSSSSSSTGSSGLSSGAIIGIGVGVGVGIACLLIGAALGFFLRRRKDSSRIAGYEHTPNQLHGDGMHEAAGTPVYTPNGQYTPRGWSAHKQMPLVPPSELSTDQSPRELPASQK